MEWSLAVNAAVKDNRLRRTALSALDRSAAKLVRVIFNRFDQITKTIKVLSFP